MSEYNLSEIKEKISGRIDSKRMEHTIGVCYTAASLAMRYNTDDKTDLITKSMVAGLLHDNAKCMDNNELLTKSRTAGITVTESQVKNPFLLHGPLGSYFAHTEHFINDTDILNAIYWHTTGRPDMSLLEQIIFVADYIEPMRTRQKNLPQLRRLAFLDLEECVYRIADDTLDYLKEKGSEIDEMTVATRDFYYGRVMTRISMEE